MSHVNSKTLFYFGRRNLVGSTGPAVLGPGHIKGGCCFFFKHHILGSDHKLLGSRIAAKPVLRIDHAAHGIAARGGDSANFEKNSRSGISKLHGNSQLSSQNGGGLTIGLSENSLRLYPTKFDQCLVIRFNSGIWPNCLAQAPYRQACKSHKSEKPGRIRVVHLPFLPVLIFDTDAVLNGQPSTSWKRRYERSYPINYGCLRQED
jgi:hypothetical protein